MSKHNNQYCVNPETKRNIRIGGKTWMRLVKTNKLDEGTYRHPNVGFQTEETYDENALENEETQNAVLHQLAEQKQYMIDNNLVPAGKVLHIKPPRKGFRTKGKIVYRDRNLTAREATKTTADAAMSVIDQIQNGEVAVPSDMNRDQAHEYLQGLIFNKMLSVGTKFKNMKLMPKNIRSSEYQSLQPLQQPPLIRQKAIRPSKKYRTIAPKKKKNKILKKKPVISNSKSKSISAKAIVYEEYDPNATETEYETEYIETENETETETEIEYEPETETETEDVSQTDYTTEEEPEVEYVYE